MPISGITTLMVGKVQKKQPKGPEVASSLESAYKDLGKEIKSEYPYAPVTKKMSYGSSGDAYGSN